MLDATESFAVPNILPAIALNWNGRKVTKYGKSSWVNLVPSQLFTENYLVSFKVSDDGSIEGNIRTSFDNYVALAFGKNPDKLSEEELVEELEEEYTIETENFKITNKEDLGKKATRSFKFYGEDFVEWVNGKLYVAPMVFFAKTKNPFKNEKREFPVEYVIPW